MVSSKMKRTIKILLALSFFISASAYSSVDYPDMNRPIGVGIMLGIPTGVTGKFFVDTDNAVTVGLGMSFMRETAFHAHADYNYHLYDLLKVQDRSVPFYFGGGFRIKTETLFRFGVRIPVGIEYPLDTDPLVFHFEVVPILDFAPEFTMSINVSLGARYYF